MTISVPSRPIVGSTIRVADLNSSMQTDYQVRSVARSSFQLLDVATGEVQERTFDIRLSGKLAEKLGVNEGVGVSVASALGNNTNKVSICDIDGDLRVDVDGKTDRLQTSEYRQTYRSKRYRLRNVGKRILGGSISPSGRQWRTCLCGSVRQDAGKDVVGRYDDGRAHYTNLILCGSVWTCPVCANKVTQERRRQIAAITAKLGEEEGRMLKCVLLTYTLQHRLRDALKMLFDDLKAAVKASQTGRKRKELVTALGILGYVRSVEIRWNEETGWHPHIHELLFVDSDMPNDEIIKMIQDGTGAKYRKKLNKLGYVTNEHTFDARIADNVDEYLTKGCLELEVTDGQGKTGRNGSKSLSPFQLLNEIDETGQAWHVDRFKEYAHATFRKRQITFSRGLLASCDVDDRKDSEIVDDRETVGRDVVSIPLKVWQNMVRRGMTAALLSVIEDHKGSFDLVAKWMIDNGLIVDVETVRPLDIFEYKTKASLEGDP